jgi:hypothetical protein
MVSDVAVVSEYVADVFPRLSTDADIALYPVALLPVVQQGIGDGT